MSTIRQLDTRSWHPEYPVIVFSLVGEELLTDADRDYIWHELGVPVFEYLLDSSGRIIAKECEAHEGLHMEVAAVAEGWGLTDEPCACGRASSRLLGIREIEAAALELATL